MNEQLSLSAWQSTLALLERISSNAPASPKGRREGSEGTDGSSARTRGKCATKPASAHLEIIERHSADIITLSWCDATTGRYGEQRWKLMRSRASGVCVLSGERIRRGDLVYRPCTRGHTPSNANWMLLASAIANEPCDALLAAQPFPPSPHAEPGTEAHAVSTEYLNPGV
jgi:hypothetical protein